VLLCRSRTGPSDLAFFYCHAPEGVPEARRLLRLATTPMSQAARDLGYAWSRWRRRHQARARWHHYHAQLKAARVLPGWAGLGHASGQHRESFSGQVGQGSRAARHRHEDRFGRAGHLGPAAP
jgi:hypothetical protein